MSAASTPEPPTRAPQVRVTGWRQNMSKTERAPKPRVSNVFLTLNTNQIYKDGDASLENDVEVFDGVIGDILNHIEEYVRLREGDKWDDATIKDADIDCVVERGPKRGQLHCHVLFKFKHFTQLQLDYSKIKSKLKSELGLNGIYCYSKLLKPNYNDSIVDYLNKYV